MFDKNNNSYKATRSYQLSPDQLAEIHRKYGRPGEIAPGQPATRKRNLLDTVLTAMDRKDKQGVTSFNDENEFEPDLH